MVVMSLVGLDTSFSLMTGLYLVRIKSLVPTRLWVSKGLEPVRSHNERVRTLEHLQELPKSLP
jgi:hypothetical protein